MAGGFAIAATAEETEGRRSRGGRPTRAAAAERDERLLEIAAAMFMEHGFDATSMDRLAEAAAIGKATLYARYHDKAALFAAVLRRRILQLYEPLELEVAAPLAGADLSDMLERIADRMLAKLLVPDAMSLARILAAQAPSFPELAELAVREGYGRQLRLVEAVLGRFTDDARYSIGDLPLAADLFLGLVLGRASRLSLYGVALDADRIRQRTRAAVAFFLRGIARR